MTLEATIDRIMLNKKKIFFIIIIKKNVTSSCTKRIKYEMVKWSSTIKNHLEISLH